MIDETRFSRSFASIVDDCTAFFMAWKIEGQLWDFIPPSVFELPANDG